jgi:hypothetical protein
MRYENVAIPAGLAWGLYEWDGPQLAENYATRGRSAGLAGTFASSIAAGGRAGCGGGASMRRKHHDYQGGH